MAIVSGTVEDESGDMIDGATVIAIKESDDSVAGITTTNSEGEFEISDLDVDERYHLAASYSDGDTDYNGLSFPSVEPFLADGPIDDFEDNDIDEYEGDTLSFGTQVGTVDEGSFALEMSNDDGNTHTIRSFSGLPRYPEAGDTFEFQIYFESFESAGEFHFGVEDSDNYYRAIVDPSVPFIGLDVIEDGDSTRLGTGSDSIPSGEWLEGVIEWNPNEEGDIIFTLNDASDSKIADAGGNDETFTSGGIGWAGEVPAFFDNSIYYDLAEITEAGEPVEPDIIVIDSFEDDDLGEYDGDTGSVNLVDSPVYDGDVAAEIPPETEIRSKDGDGLNEYPEQGDIFEFYHHFPEDAKPRFYFGLQDSSNYYYVELDEPNSELILEKVESDSASNLGTDSVTFDTDDWVRTEVEWRTNGRMLVRHFDADDDEVGSIDVTDETFTSGGVGWGEWSSPAIIDDFEDGDVSEYSGDTDDVTVQTDTVYDGDYALKWDTGNGNHIQSMSGLDNYPSQGDTWRFYFRLGTDGSIQPQFMLNGDGWDDNSYRVRATNGSFGLDLTRIEDGDFTELASSNPDFPTEEWLKMEYEYANDGTHTITVYDSDGSEIDSISATDETHTSGGVAWGWFGEEPIYYDEAGII